MQRKEPRDRRDFQRQRLYNAENRVSDGPRWDSLLAAQAYVDELLTSPWWHRHFPSVRCVVLFDHGGKDALAHKGGHGGAIRLPYWARTPLTLMHELAHIASPRTTVGHDPVYAGIYLLLVQHCLGERVASLLARHFAARRVRVQPYEGPRQHFYRPRRRGVARQGIAARVHPTTPTNGL
jgi:putative metallohydrolase (TIGR04338 family)